MSMTGNRVLLVGGTSGLSLAVARAVAERGAQPIVASRRQASVDRAVLSLPAGAAGYTVDIASEDSLAQLVSTVGAVDHLVYTAGEALQLTHLADLTPEVIRRFWETRYIGAISVVWAVVMSGALKEGGSIVLTGGNAGQRPARVGRGCERIRGDGGTHTRAGARAGADSGQSCCTGCHSQSAMGIDDRGRGIHHVREPCVSAASRAGRRTRRYRARLRVRDAAANGHGNIHHRRRRSRTRLKGEPSWTPLGRVARQGSRPHRSR
jgi:NAD(P)-dependent dehydrogenase (short-subunit alcohol dehydrogenase family)